MIVVDVNVIVYLWMPGMFTEAAERLLSHDSDWVTSTLWRSEFRNVLAGYFRKKALTLKEVSTILKHAEKQLDGKEYRVPSEAVFTQIAESNCSAYDCEYVALAKDLGVHLITADKKMLREFPKTCIPLKSFLKN